MKTIPGTEVPDNVLHRASLWLEDRKFGDRAGVASEPELSEVKQHWSDLLDEFDVPLTPDEVREGSFYYAQNWRRMVFAGMDVVIPTPDGNALNLATLLQSLWLDAFEHGLAVAHGKSALSIEERLTDGEG
jgi:hypothetical protein